MFDPLGFSRPKAVNFDPGEYPDPSQFDKVELKFDGWMGILVFHGSEWKLWSRTGMLKKQGTLSGSVSLTVLYGEFIYGTEWAKDRPHLYERVALFGAEYIDGTNFSKFSNSDVRWGLSEYITKMYSMPDEIFQRLFLVDQFPVQDAPQVWEEMVILQDYEGLIFKNSKQSWEQGFGRMKRRVTVDYVFLGIEESDSDTYRGWGAAAIVGGLYVDGELTRVCKVSGLTNELRKDLFDNRDKYVGRVFEAQGKKLSKRGALRHPDFLRWRDDKRAEDCIWSALRK